MPDFHFLSSASVLASHYSAIYSSFSTFFPFSPHRWLFRCSCSALAFQVFPLISGLVSRAFFPVLCTRLSVSFLSSFLASLPQLFRKCLPGLLSLSVPLTLAFSPSLPLSFVRFFSGSNYSAFRFFFSLLPFPASRWLSRCLFILVPFRLFPCFRFRFGTQLSCISFLRSTFSHYRCYFSCRPPVSSSAVPLSFRFRFWLLGLGEYTLKTEHHNFFLQSRIWSTL